MMRIKTWAGVATLTLVGAMATSAIAQSGGVVGGRGGRGGFGAGMSGPPSPVQLANHPAVQKELGASDDQVAKLKTLGEEARAELQTAGGAAGLQGLQELPPEERRAKQVEAVRRVNEKYKSKLAEILDKKQVQRLDQIALQFAGDQAYADPAVVASLELSKDQQDKIASINKEFGEKSRELIGGGRARDPERIAKFVELQSRRTTDLAAVLTVEQQTQFAALKGEKFNVGSFLGGQDGASADGNGRPPRAPQ